ncbi:hypothetical protein K8R66_02340 [bacterium]|nr:hypothetical protein [bacterium]
MDRNIVQKAKEYAISETEKFGTSIMDHFELSENKALELAEKFDVNIDIVKIGVYLMDVKLGEAKKSDKLTEHVQMSVGATKEFLSKFNISDEEKDKILNCVGAHHAQIPFICKEVEICCNADCYRFIHPRGIFAYLNLLGRRFDNVDDCLKQVEKKMEEKYNALSLDICKEELEEYYQKFKRLIEDSKLRKI